MPSVHPPATQSAPTASFLSPGLDRNYFIKCLEETANIGNPRDIKLRLARELAARFHDSAAAEQAIERAARGAGGGG